MVVRLNPTEPERDFPPCPDCETPITLDIQIQTSGRCLSCEIRYLRGLVYQAITSDYRLIEIIRKQGKRLEELTK